MGIHDGHRDRLRSRFLEHGLDSFNELNALELLLFYAIPRKDTNPIAHALLDRFGSLHGVFDAGIRELTEVEGVGESAAALIKLIPQIVRKSYISRCDSNPVITNSKEAAEYLVPRFLYEKDEFILLLCLDSRKRLISCTEIGRGVVNSVDINVRRIAEIALKSRASYIMISHNHPDSTVLPSREDDYVTHQVYNTMQSIGIPLMDHIIVSGEEYSSYFDTGMLGMYRR